MARARPSGAGPSGALQEALGERLQLPTDLRGERLRGSTGSIWRALWPVSVITYSSVIGACPLLCNAAAMGDKRSYRRIRCRLLLRA